MRYGSIPAGGLGLRLQPLGFSKELAPVAGRAAIEYLLERMVKAGIDKIFVNVAEDKTDLVRYLSAKSPYVRNLVFTVLPREGLMEGIVAPAPFLRPDDVLYFGLPDTIWYPVDGFHQLDSYKSKLVLGLFDTGTPDRFDSVATDNKDKITSIEVKVEKPKSDWTWGIGKLTVSEVPLLRQADKKLFGEAMNTYIQDHSAYAVKLDSSHYLDIGILSDYQEAEEFVRSHS